MSVSAIGCDILVKCSLDYAERKYYFYQYGTKWPNLLSEATA